MSKKHLRNDVEEEKFKSIVGTYLDLIEGCLSVRLSIFRKGSHLQRLAAVHVSSVLVVEFGRNFANLSLDSFLDNILYVCKSS